MLREADAASRHPTTSQRLNQHLRATTPAAQAWFRAAWFSPLHPLHPTKVAHAPPPKYTIWQVWLLFDD
eukprot:1982696-Prymnesium_polylepis.2